MSKEKIREFFNNKWEWMGLQGGLKTSREAGFCPDKITNEVIYENTLQNGDVINLFDEFGHGVIIYQDYGFVWHYYISMDELKKLKYTSIEVKSWLMFSVEYRKKIERYLELVGRFRKDPLSLSLDEKQWVLSNASLPTDLVPVSISSKYL